MAMVTTDDRVKEMEDNALVVAAYTYLKLRTFREDRHGPRGPYDRARAYEFFDSLMFKFSTTKKITLLCNHTPLQSHLTGCVALLRSAPFGNLCFSSRTCLATGFDFSGQHLR